MKKIIKVATILLWSGCLMAHGEEELSISTDTKREILYHAPYLQNPSDNGMTVMFQTTVPAYCVVEYGVDTLQLSTAKNLIGGQAVCHDIEQKIRLSNLNPGEKYYYRVRAREILTNHAYSKTFGEEQVSPFYSFTLPKETIDDFTAVVLNDLHEHEATIAALSVLTREIGPDLLVFNGDCLPEPEDRAYAMKHIHKLADAFDSANIPTLFIRGNHEIRNAYSSGMPSLFDNPGGKTYGAMNWGDIRIVMLDCGEDKPDDTWVYYGLNDFTGLREEQAEFLKDELSSEAYKEASRRVLIHHIPVWGNVDEYKPCTTLWTDILSESNFDIDLAGHNHEYRYIEAGSADGNPMPVLIGGGPRVEESTITVLRKYGDSFTAEVLDAKGNQVLMLEL